MFLIFPSMKAIKLFSKQAIQFIFKFCKLSKQQ